MICPDRRSASRRISEVVQRSSGWFTNESRIGMLDELIKHHHSCAKGFSAGEDVQFLPRGPVVPPNDLVDHVHDFATVSTEVVAKIND